jgi:hypothetical protein
MKTRIRPWLFFSLVAILTVPVTLWAFSYTYPLSSTDIRDAYFIGRRNDEFTQEFLSKYTKTFPVPASGPHIQQISIETPYTQIVMHAARTLNYDAPTAVQDFQGKPLPFRVHVQIYVTPSYSLQQVNPTDELYPEFPEIWQDFKITMTQDAIIAPNSLYGGFLYNTCDLGCPVPIGAWADAVYDPEKIDAAPTEIKVTAPDGQEVIANFDLSALR